MVSFTSVILPPRIQAENLGTEKEEESQLQLPELRYTVCNGLCFHFSVSKFLCLAFFGLFFVFGRGLVVLRDTPATPARPDFLRQFLRRIGPNLRQSGM